jgi:hypothetical protein
MGMDELISEIEAYCARAGIKPQRLLRDAINAGHGQWAAWMSGRSSPTMKVVDRLRAYMAAHPADTYQARKPGAAA